MKRQSIRRDPSRLAGWVFADLMLALTLVGLATGVARPASDDQTVTTTTTTAPVHPQGLSRTPVIVDFARVDAPDIQAEVNTALSAVGLDGKRIGMAIVWGHSVDFGRGIALADAFQRVLAANPQFEGSAFKSIRYQDRREGAIHVELYPLVDVP
jgi:hypothetical protein